MKPKRMPMKDAAVSAMDSACKCGERLFDEQGE